MLELSTGGEDLADALRVDPRHLRSARLDRDFDDPTSSLHYVVTPFLEATIARIARGLAKNSTSRAWRLTGDYGTGKSSQRTKATERQYVPNDVMAVAAALRDDAPCVAADLKAVVLDAIDQVQARIGGSSTDTVDLFYDGETPKDEERCRNALLDLLAPVLAYGIVWSPEERMPSAKRADAGFRLGAMRVPLEAKLAWNRSLWTACGEQLDRLYASADHLAGGQGIYLVFWFGQARSGGRTCTRSPQGRRPATIAELEGMLGALPMVKDGDRISIVVLDLSRRGTPSQGGTAG